MPAQAIARLKYCSIPPRKMRLVADLVKGMPIQKALDTLNFTPRIAAYHLAKTLKSAAANAMSLEGTAHLKPEDLVVKNIIVDEAPMAKRIRFQSMGRVFRYRRRYSHLTVLLEEKAHPKPKAARVAEGGTDKTDKEVEARPSAKTPKPKAAKTAKKKPTAKAKKSK